MTPPPPRWIGPDELRAALTPPAAAAALEAAFADGLPGGPLRTAVAGPDGDLLLMPAAGAVGAGVKLVAIAAGNPARGLPLIQGVYVLFAPGTLVPLALVDGAELTA